MAEQIIDNAKDKEEKKEGETKKIDLNKLAIGTLKIKKNQLSKRGEEIVDVKEKLINYLSQIKEKNYDNPEFITKNEAKRERRRIERLFTKETDVQEEARIKKEIITEIKRKYTIQFREAVRFILELVILQLLLFSCAQRSNIVSIIYLGLLLMYIRIENKE